MLEDLNFWEVESGASLRVELDAFAVAQLADAHAKSELPRPLVGLLLGGVQEQLVRVWAAAVLGPPESVRELDESGKLEAFVRHFERVHNASAVGWFSSVEEGFELTHQRLGRFRTSAFVFLLAAWEESEHGFRLEALSSAANRHFRQAFSVFLRVPLRVVARQLPSPGLWGLLSGEAGLEAETTPRPGPPPLCLTPPLAAPERAEARAQLQSRLQELEAGLAAAEDLFRQSAAIVSGE